MRACGGYQTTWRVTTGLGSAPVSGPADDATAAHIRLPQTPPAPRATRNSLADIWEDGIDDEAELGLSLSSAFRHSEVGASAAVCANIRDIQVSISIHAPTVFGGSLCLCRGNFPRS